MDTSNKRKKVYITGNIIITCQCNQKNMWCSADDSYKNDADEIIEGDWVVYKENMIDENVDYYAFGTVAKMDAFIPKSAYDAKDIYDISVNEIISLLNCSINSNLSHVLYKYAFIGVFAAFEYFLCNVCRCYIIKENVYMEKFLKSNKKYKNETFKMYEIFSKYSSIKKLVDEYICDIVYHNTTKVCDIFYSVFDIKLDMTDFVSYVLIRHDIIHRNGRTKNGSLTYVTKKLVNDLIECTNGIVEQVCAGLKEKSIISN